MATRSVTGTVLRPNGTAWVGGLLTFTLRASTYTAGGFFPTDAIAAVTDSNGAFSAALEEGLAGTWIAQFPDGTQYGFVLPDGDSPVTLVSLLAAAAAAPDTDALTILVDSHTLLTTGVHGVGAGSVVGTTLSQTLTNKTLTAPVIATIANTGTLTLPSSTDTLVGRATTDTLTNKTLTTPTIGSFTNATHTHTNAAGGGTLARTVFNVFEYGATGDGVADDTAEIQSAIDAAEAAGGGVAYLPHGTYKVTAAVPSGANQAALQLGSGVTLRGAGMDATRVFLANASDTRVVTNKDHAGGTTVGVAIEDLEIDGNRANLSGSDTFKDAVYFSNAARIRVERCHIHDGYRHCLHFSGSSSTTKCDRAVVLDNRIGDAGSSPIALSADKSLVRGNELFGSTDATAKFGNCIDLVVQGNRAHGNDGGFSLLDSGQNNVFVGNVSDGDQSGLQIWDCTDVVVVGNTILSPEQFGIKLLNGPQRVVIAANTIRNPSQATANTYDGIWLSEASGTMSDILIADNIVTDNSSKMRYGVNATDNAPERVHILANLISGEQTGKINVAGARLIGNPGVVASTSTVQTTVAAGDTNTNSASVVNFATTATILANSMVVGKTYRFTARGVLSTDASAAGTLELRIRFGTTTICTTGAVAQGNALVTRGWEVDALIICATLGASGSVLAQGRAHVSQAANTAQSNDMETTAAVTVDTTADQTVRMASVWGTADTDNTITMRQFVFEEVN